LCGADAAIARAYGSSRRPVAERLAAAAAAMPGLIERRPRYWRGPCPACEAGDPSGRALVMSADAAGTIQRHCHRHCTLAEVQAAAPLLPDVVYAYPMPPGWRDVVSEHGARLRLWWHHAAAAADALPPRARGRVLRGLYAFGAVASRAGAAEFSASAATLGRDAGRAPRRMRGEDGIVAAVLRLPGSRVARVAAGGAVWTGDHWGKVSGRYRLTLPPLEAAADAAAGPPAVPPGGNFARGARGEVWRTLAAWYAAADRAPVTLADVAAAAGAASSRSVRAHVLRLVALGLALEVAPEATGRRGRPACRYMLTADAVATIAAGDDVGLARLAAIAPDRQNLRGAAERAARAAAARSDERLAKWRPPASAVAAARTAADAAPLEAPAADAAALAAADAADAAALEGAGDAHASGTG